MEPHSEHRMMLGTDIERYSDRNGSDQNRLQWALVSSLTQAATAAKLAFPEWECQPQGDGQFVVLPVSTDRYAVLGAFITALAEAVAAQQTATFRVRMRLSVHEGPIQLDGPNGYPGDHAVQTNRLVGAQSLRAALAARPEAWLGVIISDRVFADYVGQRPGGPPRDQFRRVDVAEKNQRYVAYLHLPGHNVHALDLASAPPANPPGGAAGPVYNFSGTGSNVAVHGDQTNHQTFRS